MKLNIINEKNEVTCSYTDATYIIMKLLEELFNKTVVGAKHIKRTTYNYNYTDKQTIKFKLDNGYTHEFVDIPTMGGYLDAASLYNLIKGGE